MKIINALPPRIRRGKVAIDLELFGLDPNRLHRPHGDFALAAFTADGETVYSIQNAEMLPKAWERVQGATIVGHNLAFDIGHLRRWVDIPTRSGKNTWDTMLIDHILFGGLFDRFGLDDLSRRWLATPLSKVVRDSFKKARKAVTLQQAIYNANDACVTWKVAQAQETALEAHPDSWNVWEHFDGPAMWAILDFKGIMLDIPRWLQIAEAQRAKFDALSKQLGINPNSPPQVKQFLYGLGLKKLESTGEEVLNQFTDREEVRMILDAREASKMSSTYGRRMVDQHVEKDGRIYASYKTIGAETGRMSSASPNMQNIPSSAMYRECFIAGPGNVLIVADYAQQEPRIAAEVSKDEHLLEVFRRHEDIHLTVARAVYDDPKMEKKDPRRKDGKIIGLAALYGLSANGMALRTKKSVDECRELLNAYFQRFPGVLHNIYATRSYAEEHGYVTTLTGQRVWINPHNYQWRNNAINSPIQGSAAAMTKLAFSYLHQKMGADFPLVAAVHDELVAEVPAKKAVQVKKLITKAMTTAYRELLPHVDYHAIVDVHIGKNWNCKNE